jgi:dTDP-glucose pyrophosphorylase
MQGIILAAGKGSRLQQITLTRSKAMLPILGKPIVERVISTARWREEFRLVAVMIVISRITFEPSRSWRRKCAVYQPQRLGMANAPCAAPHHRRFHPPPVTTSFRRNTGA